MHREARHQLRQSLSSFIIPHLFQNDNVCTHLREDSSHLHKMLVPFFLGCRWFLSGEPLQVPRDEANDISPIRTS